MSFFARIVALFLFLAAAIIVFHWFSVTSGPDPGGLVALGFAAWVLAELIDSPAPRYFRR